jgi:hypothetical protein
LLVVRLKSKADNGSGRCGLGEGLVGEAILAAFRSAPPPPCAGACRATHLGVGTGAGGCRGDAVVPQVQSGLPLRCKRTTRLCQHQ